MRLLPSKEQLLFQQREIIIMGHSCVDALHPWLEGKMELPNSGECSSCVVALLELLSSLLAAERRSREVGDGVGDDAELAPLPMAACELLASCAWPPSLVLPLLIFLEDAAFILPESVWPPCRDRLGGVVSLRQVAVGDFAGLLRQMIQLSDLLLQREEKWAAAESQEWLFLIRLVYSTVPDVAGSTTDLVTIQALHQRPKVLGAALHSLQQRPATCENGLRDSDDIVMLLLLLREASPLESCALSLFPQSSERRSMIESSILRLIDSSHDAKGLVERCLSPVYIAEVRGAPLIEVALRRLQLGSHYGRQTSPNPRCGRPQKDPTCADADLAIASAEGHEAVSSLVLACVFEIVPSFRPRVLRQLLGGLLAAGSAACASRYLAAWEAVIARAPSCSQHESQIIVDALPPLTLLPTNRACRVIEGCISLGQGSAHIAVAILNLCRKCIIQPHLRGRMLALHALSVLTLIPVGTLSSPYSDCRWRSDVSRAFKHALGASLPLGAKALTYESIWSCSAEVHCSWLMRYLRRRLLLHFSTEVSASKSTGKRPLVLGSNLVWAPLRAFEGWGQGSSCLREDIGRLLQCVWRLEKGTLKTSDNEDGPEIQLARAVLGAEGRRSTSSFSALLAARSLVSFLSRGGQVHMVEAEGRATFGSHAELDDDQNSNISETDDDENSYDEDEEASALLQCDGDCVSPAQRLALIAEVSEALAGCLVESSEDPVMDAVQQLLAVRSIAVLAIAHCSSKAARRSPVMQDVARSGRRLKDALHPPAILGLRQGLEGDVAIRSHLPAPAALAYLVRALSLCRPGEESTRPVADLSWPFWLSISCSADIFQGEIESSGLSDKGWVSLQCLEDAASILLELFQRLSQQIVCAPSDLPVSRSGRRKGASPSTVFCSNKGMLNDFILGARAAKGSFDPLEAAAAEIETNHIGCLFDAQISVGAALNCVLSILGNQGSRWAVQQAPLLLVADKVTDESQSLCEAFCSHLAAGLEEGLPAKLVAAYLDLIQAASASHCRGCGCGLKLLSIMNKHGIAQVSLFKRMCHTAFQSSAGLSILQAVEIWSHCLTELLAYSTSARATRMQHVESDGCDSESACGGTATSPVHVLRLQSRRNCYECISALLKRFEEYQDEENHAVMSSLMLLLREPKVTDNSGDGVPPVRLLPEGLQSRVAVLLGRHFSRTRSAARQLSGFLSHFSQQLSSSRKMEGNTKASCDTSNSCKPLETLLRVLGCRDEQTEGTAGEKKCMATLVKMWVSGSREGARDPLRKRLTKLVFKWEKCEVEAMAAAAKADTILSQWSAAVPESLAKSLRVILAEIDRIKSRAEWRLEDADAAMEAESDDSLEPAESMPRSKKRNRTSKRRRIRSRNPTIDEWLAEEGGGDDGFVDLEGFIANDDDDE
jgi:hypothetical protein